MSNKKDICKFFAAEVNERMDELGLRPYHLIALCKIKTCHIDSCLNGTFLPGIFSLVLLAEHLECTVNDLLDYEEVDKVSVYEPYMASSMYFVESQYAMCLSYRVRKYLDERSISISELAKNAEISVDSMRRWFAKTHPHLPPTLKLLQICDALDCTPSELLGY